MRKKLISTLVVVFVMAFNLVTPATAQLETEYNHILCCSYDEHGFYNYSTQVDIEPHYGIWCFFGLNCSWGIVVTTSTQHFNGSSCLRTFTYSVRCQRCNRVSPDAPDSQTRTEWFSCNCVALR